MLYHDSAAYGGRGEGTGWDSRAYNGAVSTGVVLHGESRSLGEPEKARDGVEVMA
jgi:hypothetical protein